MQNFYDSDESANDEFDNAMQMLDSIGQSNQTVAKKKPAKKANTNEIGDVKRTGAAKQKRWGFFQSDEIKPSRNPYESTPLFDRITKFIESDYKTYCKCRNTAINAVKIATKKDEKEIQSYSDNDLKTTFFKDIEPKFVKGMIFSDYEKQTYDWINEKYKDHQDVLAYKECLQAQQHKDYLFLQFCCQQAKAQNLDNEEVNDKMICDRAYALLQKVHAIFQMKCHHKTTKKREYNNNIKSIRNIMCKLFPILSNENMCTKELVKTMLENATKTEHPGSDPNTNSKKKYKSLRKWNQNERECFLQACNNAFEKIAEMHGTYKEKFQKWKNVVKEELEKTCQTENLLHFKKLKIGTFLTVYVRHNEKKNELDSNLSQDDYKKALKEHRIELKNNAKKKLPENFKKQQT